MSEERETNYVGYIVILLVIGLILAALFPKFFGGKPKSIGEHIVRASKPTGEAKSRSGNTINDKIKPAETV